MVGIFNKLKYATAAARLVEEQLYEHVAKELRQGMRREGLWAKALANCDGNDEKAKALYLRYRVQSIRDESEIASAIAEQAKSRAQSSASKVSPKSRTGSQKPATQENTRPETVSEGPTFYICNHCKALNTKPGKCQRCEAVLGG